MTTVIVREEGAIVVGSVPRGTVRVVQKQTIVQDKAQPRTVVRAGGSVRQVEPEQTVVKVATQGTQGPQGIPGVSGAGLTPPIDFSFGDASPTVVRVLAERSEIVEVSLQIEEAFDGPGAAIALGTATDPELLVAFAHNDPSLADTVFEFSPRVELSAGAELVLTIVPGAGATQGYGQFVLTTVPSN